MTPEDGHDNSTKVLQGADSPRHNRKKWLFVIAVVASCVMFTISTTLTSRYYKSSGDGIQVTGGAISHKFTKQSEGEVLGAWKVRNTLATPIGIDARFHLSGASPRELSGELNLSYGVAVAGQSATPDGIEVLDSVRSESAMSWIPAGNLDRPLSLREACQRAAVPCRVVVRPHGEQMIQVRAGLEAPRGVRAELAATLDVQAVRFTGSG